MPILRRRMKCSTLGFATARTSASTAVLAVALGCGAATAAVPVEDSLFRAAAELDTQTYDARINDDTEEAYDSLCEKYCEPSPFDYEPIEVTK